MDAWRELDEPWRVALELAWEAYLAGTIPVGSVGVYARGAGERVLELDGNAPQLEDALPRLLDCL